MAWYIWLILAGFFLIVETMTMGFLIFWLSIGSLITMLVSFVTSNIIIQFTVFVISSTLLIFGTKPLVKKFGLQETVPTNVYSIVNKNAMTIEEINNLKGTGLIKINGETWSAISEDNSIIEKGTEVVIKQIKGVKVIVSKINYI